MACFPNGNRRRCPRCSASPRRGTAQAAEALRGATRCGTACTTAQELYAGTASAAVQPQTCCDPDCGCRQFSAGRRNPFWPAFAHPRWLSCNALYRHGCGR